MKKMIAMVLALTMTLTTAFALAETEDASITVQGTATVTAEPDMVSVTANASITDPSVSGAQEKMNAIIAEVTGKLIELGVKEEDIVTQNYSYYPTYNYEGETRTLTGYQANHTLEITCRDVEMLDSVVGVVTDSGMSEIYGIQYDISERSALYQDALALAIESAQAKAVKMAEASDMTITGLEELRENGGYDAGVVVNTAMDAAVMSARAESGGTGIRAGSVSVTANVTAVYEAKGE